MNGYGPAPAGHSCEDDGWCEYIHPSPLKRLVMAVSCFIGRITMHRPGLYTKCPLCDEWHRVASR